MHKLYKSEHRPDQVVEPLEPRRLFTTYFVDATSGSDLNSGRSARTPWQTLTMVDSHSFKNGDTILLTGTFTDQTLALGPDADGVSVNSYALVGAKKVVRVGVANAALIADTQADGIDITTSNVTIQNISITADPAVVSSGNYNFGIYLHNSTSIPLTHEVINHVTATGFSYAGLCMQGWNSNAADSAGFSDVLIENSAFFANQVSGIFAGAGDSTGNEFQPAFPADLYVNSKLTIRNCQTYDNAGSNPALRGTPDNVNFNNGNSTSGGIFISSVNGATVQHCTVYNNCFAALGGVGQWAFDATRVVFENDESYDNKTAGDGDGDGFDLDHGVTHSLMEYDYSHGNAGAGFLIATTGGTSNDDGDTIRFCIADDNYAGIWIETPPAVPVLYANVYNNTLLTSVASPDTGLAVIVAGDTTASDDVSFLNNIFYSDGATPLVLETAPEPNVRFERNDYWLAGSPGSFGAYFDGTAYTSLAGWSTAAGGEESLNGKIIGLVEDPMLVNENVSAGTLGLARNSLLRRQGLNLASSEWAGRLPYKLDKPYNLAGPAWNGIGDANFFGKPPNDRAIGAG